jgi:hypothetical protein
MREGVYPDLLCQGEEVGHFFATFSTDSWIHTDFQFVYSNVRFLTDIKTKIKHAVQYSYGFDTSRAPGSIGRNARRAQALLSRMTFIYRVRLMASPLQLIEHRYLVTGSQLWRASTISISTSHYPDSDQPHVVPEQGRRRDSLL